MYGSSIVYCKNVGSPLKTKLKKRPTEKDWLKIDIKHAWITHTHLHKKTRHIYNRYYDNINLIIMNLIQFNNGNGDDDTNDDGKFGW